MARQPRNKENPQEKTQVAVEKVSRHVGRIKKKINKNNTTRGLFLFVILPVILSIVYYYIFAADIYVTESKYSVNIEGSSSVGGGAMGMLMPAIGNASNLHEAMTVREYITSAPIVDKLEKSIGLRRILDSPKADFLSRVSSGLSKEDFLLEYRKKVEVILDEQSGISTLIVRAFTPQESEKLANAVLDMAEDFVNKMSERMRDDAVKYSKQELEKAEQEVVEVNKQLAVFRNVNKSFDPSVTAGSILDITSRLEAELATTNSELANLRNFMKDGSPRIASLEAKAAALRDQIQAQNRRLASEEGSKLADITQDYETLALKKEFAQKKYEVAFSAYESAQAEARKKSKYLLRIVEPGAAETAIEPNRPRQIITVFLVCLITYTLGMLMIAAIKDHIRP